MITTGVIKLKDASTLKEGEHIGAGSKAALVYGQMNEPPGARARVALTGLAVAEYFRDEEGQDVLLFIDNIFRFTQAGSEVTSKRIFKQNSDATRNWTIIIFFPPCCRCLPFWVVFPQP